MMNNISSNNNNVNKASQLFAVNLELNEMNNKNSPSNHINMATQQQQRPQIANLLESSNNINILIVCFIYCL